MSLGRLIGILLVVAIGWWVIAKSGLFTRSESAPDSSLTPIERARDAARKNAERNLASSTTQNEADAVAPSGGSVTENMTPEQVRKLLGSPTEVQSETIESGGQRERWLYPSVGKTVVFENGVVVAIQ